MSYKISTFNGLIQKPLLTSNFVIDVPGLLTGPTTIQAASFPGFEAQETSVFYRGHEIRIATRPKLGPFEWTVTVPDNFLGMNGFSFQDYFLWQFTPKTEPTSVVHGIKFFNKTDRKYWGRMLSVNDIYVYPTTGVGVSQSDIVKTNSSTVNYINSVVGIDIPVVLLKAILRDCYLKKIAEVKLDASNPTNPWKWELTFVYNGVSFIATSPSAAKAIFETVKSVNRIF